MPRPLSEEKQQAWRESILRQRQSGLPITKWCRENNIEVHVFGYWQSKLFPKTSEKYSFTEIHDRKDLPAHLKEAGISIQYNGMHIHLKRQFDPSTLKQCLKVLKEC
jgi:hypothetical protein